MSLTTSFPVPPTRRSRSGSVSDVEPRHRGTRL